MPFPKNESLLNIRIMLKSSFVELYSRLFGEISLLPPGLSEFSGRDDTDGFDLFSDALCEASSRGRLLPGLKAPATAACASSASVLGAFLLDEMPSEAFKVVGESSKPVLLKPLDLNLMGGFFS